MNLNNKAKHPTNSLFFILYVAALTAFGPFSTDIYLASMPVLQQLFATTTAQVQLTLSGFFVGFAVMQLIWGPLSDRIGRRPVVFIGISLFVASSLLCALSNTITMLIISRILQAMGACAAIVMAMAMIRDQFPEQKQMTNVIGSMMNIFVLAPMTAPIIGGYLLVHLGWQSNFYFLMMYGAILILATCFISESHPPILRKPLPFNKLGQAYIQQLCCRPFILGSLAAGTNFSVLFTFISSSAFIYITLYHVKADLFGYLFAVNAFGIICGNIVAKKLRKRWTDRQLIAFPVGLITVASGCMLLMIWQDPTDIYRVIIPSFCVTIGVGILFPQITSLALQHVVDYTGLASSLLGTVRFTIAAITGTLMGILLVTTAMPLAAVMLCLNIMTGLLMLAYFKLIPID